MEEKRPNDRFRTNAAPNCDFFVMKRHFLNLLRIFCGVNTVILLIYGTILGLTLQKQYVIKRSGISVKSDGVARWVRRIRTALYIYILIFYFSLKIIGKQASIALDHKERYLDVFKKIWTNNITVLQCTPKADFFFFNF